MIYIIADKFGKFNLEDTIDENVYKYVTGFRALPACNRQKNKIYLFYYSGKEQDSDKL